MSTLRRLVTRAVLMASGQCSVCEQRFDDWNGGVCDACRNNGNGNSN